MRVRASAKGLPLEVQYSGPIPETIRCDPTRLRQILINLVANAIKFTEVGEVRVVVRLIEADSDNAKLQFDVIDTGIGMVESQLNTLFQPFVQADSSASRKFGGTGLGLTISKRLAEMLDGTIQVQSTPGEGSTFSAIVSIGSWEGVAMVDAPIAERDEVTTQGDTQSVPPNCRILLAEDGPDNQRLISFVLKKAGADVTMVENGQMALDLALSERDKGTPFDIIIMDMQMPVLDGYEATRQLRDTGYTGPIIALTAHAMSSDRDKCLHAGCDDYTTKPIDREKLISLVEQYASQQRTAVAIDDQG